MVVWLDIQKQTQQEHQGKLDSEIRISTPTEQDGTHHFIHMTSHFNPLLIQDQLAVSCMTFSEGEREDCRTLLVLIWQDFSDVLMLLDLIKELKDRGMAQ